MRIEILPSAWQHSVTGDEIRAIITYPLLRFAIDTRYPDADTYMFIGRIADQALIEVAAEDEDGTDWVVFHAMMLTARIAREAYVHSAGAIDLRDHIPPQRPSIGPQYGREE